MNEMASQVIDGAVSQLQHYKTVLLMGVASDCSWKVNLYCFYSLGSWRLVVGRS